MSRVSPGLPGDWPTPGEAGVSAFVPERLEPEPGEPVDSGELELRAGEGLARGQDPQAAALRRAAEHALRGMLLDEGPQLGDIVGGEVVGVEHHDEAVAERVPEVRERRRLCR